MRGGGLGAVGTGRSDSQGLGDLISCATLARGSSLGGSAGARQFGGV